MLDLLQAEALRATAISSYRYAEAFGYDAREAATPDCSLGDDPEPALYLVEPGGVGRRVVDVEPWTLRQPGADLSLRGSPAVYGVLVSAVVVDDQIHVGTPEKAKTLVVQRHWAIGRR